MHASIVEAYLQLFPADEAKLARLLKQLKNGEALDDRNNFNGHAAGDALILSPDKTKILLIYHKRFGRWQQPGGHLDPGEAGPWLTAEREATEETGLSQFKRVNLAADYRIPVHIVTGPVPASPAKQEAAHWHHDFRYGFIAASEDLPEVKDEGVSGVRWLPLADYSDQKFGAHELGTSIERLKNLLSLKA